MRKMQIKRRFFLAFLSGLAIGPRICAAAGWLPIPTIEKDKPASGIAVSDKGVLTSSPSLLYRLPENGEAWRKGPMPGVQGLQATSSYHFLQSNTTLSIMDSAGTIRGTFTSAWPVFKDVAEDSLRLHLRLANDSIYIADKPDLVWRPATSTPQVAYLGLSMIAFPGRILVASAEGLYLSRDRGRSWEKAPGELGKNLVTVFRRVGNELYAGSHGFGMYRSSDTGETWSSLFPQDSPNRNLSFTGFDAFGDTLWLSSGYISPTTQGVLRSVDKGKTWNWHRAGMVGIEMVEAGNPLPYRYYPVTAVTRAGGALWASNDTRQPYRSKDGGQTWTLIDEANFAGSSLWYFFPFGTDVMALYGTGSGHQIRSYNALTQKWALDTSYFPASSFYFKGMYGDTAFISDRNGLKWRPGRSRSWETLTLPWDSTAQIMAPDAGPVLSVHPMGSELFLAQIEGQTFHHSDDGGRTWRVNRPFLPKAKFQGAWLEGRSKLLCWPDDSLHTPPKPWREFPQPIRGIWVVGGELAVRAGPILYFASIAGGAWRESPLPDTGMALGIRNGTLNGYTMDTIRTLAPGGIGWHARPLRFPFHGVKSMAAGDQGVWVKNKTFNSPDMPVNFHGQDGRIRSVPWNNVPDALMMAAGGDYLMVGWYKMMDTLRNSATGTFRQFQLQRSASPYPEAPANISSIFADGEFMAQALKGGDFRISRDFGKSWAVTGKLPSETVKIAGSPAWLFILAGGALYASRDSGRIWAAESAGLKFTSIAGTPGFLAALAGDGRILVSEDSAKTWTALPDLPGGGETIATDVAAYGRQVFAGTEEHGIFKLGEAQVISLREKGVITDAAPTPSFKRGWVRVPGQGWLYRLDADTQVDMRGRKGIPKIAD